MMNEAEFQRALGTTKVLVPQTLKRYLADSELLLEMKDGSLLVWRGGHIWETFTYENIEAFRRVIGLDKKEFSECYNVPNPEVNAKILAMGDGIVRALIGEM
jgi:hypothetical protein